MAFITIKSEEVSDYRKSTLRLNINEDCDLFYYTTKSEPGFVKIFKK